MKINKKQNTVKPPNKAHIWTVEFVRYSEVKAHEKISTKVGKQITKIADGGKIFLMIERF